MADAILLSLAAGFLFGVLAVGMRFGLTRIPDAEMGAFQSLLVGFVVAFLATAAAGQLDDLSWSDVWPFLALGAIAPGVTQVMFLFALRDIGASRSMVIYGALPLASSIGAVLFLDEPLRSVLVAGTLLVVGGTAVLAYDPVKPKDYRAAGLAWALSSIILFAGRDNLSRWLTTELEIPAIAGAATALAGGTAAILVYLLITRRGQRLLAQTVRAVPPFLVASAAFGLAYVAMLESFARGEVTVVTPIIGTYTLWTVVLSVIFLRATEAVSRRLVLAGALIVAGAAVVAATQ